MEPNFSTTPIYAGEFRHAIDPKGRLTVPAKWRRAEAEDLYILPEQKNRCLIVMPPEEFKAVGARIAAAPGISEMEKRDFLRNFYSQAQPAAVDRQGRMLLPDDYCKRVDLGTDIVLAGGDVRFEIWNPVRWKATIEEKQDVYSKVADTIGL